MDTSETINGYKIIQPFTTVGGGLCRWTFVEKGGVIYFLKEFLSPKYPGDDSPGSVKVKAQKRKRCEVFEHHHRGLKEAISTSVGVGGNLVATIDFFRSGTTYYKVTEKVDVLSLTPEDISKLPIERRMLVLKTVAHSLMVLHQLRIVHGDLKPDNILIKQTKTGDYVAKLIDFDNSYFSNSAPEISDESDIVGTPDYYSPELGKYIKQDGSVTSSDLDTASDVFALGVIYCQYLTGKKPVFDLKYRYAWESANDGLSPCIESVSLPSTLIKLVSSMLQTDPSKRPSIRTVFLALRVWDKPEKPVMSADAPVGTLRLGRGLKPSVPSTTSTHTTSADDASPSRLKGTMIKKKKP